MWDPVSTNKISFKIQNIFNLQTIRMKFEILQIDSFGIFVTCFEFYVDEKFLIGLVNR